MSKDFLSHAQEDARQLRKRARYAVIYSAGPDILQKLYSQSKEENTMRVRMNHMMSLLQSDAITVKACYVEAESQISRPREYTFKAKKGQVAVGDLFVVFTPHAAVVRVVAVDDTLNIDLAATYEYKWLVQKVDVAAYEEQQKLEAEFMNVLEAVEREKTKQSVVASMLSHLPANSELRLQLQTTVEKLGGKLPEADSLPKSLQEYPSPQK